MTSYKVVCVERGSSAGSSNAQRFATEAEAKRAGDELWSRWFGMPSWHVEACDDPVNCVADEYGRCTFTDL